MSTRLDLEHHLSAQVGRDSADELGRVLSVLTEGAHGILGHALVGVYLTGSFALGRGDAASDVDFLVVTSPEPTLGHEESARALHRTLPDRPEHWARHVEGSWVSSGAVRDRVGVHAPWLYVDNGSRDMEHSRHDDTWNARWMLRHAAIALVGPAASGLLPDVSSADLRAETAVQADRHAVWIRDEPGALRDGWAQPYIVLTHCRLLWTATFASVASKGDAAVWVRDNVAPGAFRDLIDDAIRARLRAFDPAATPDPGLAGRTSGFVEWAEGEVRARSGRRQTRR